MLKTYIAIVLMLLALAGCAQDPRASDYGYQYSSVTPMGIMYRVDPGGVPLDAGNIDYIYSVVAQCFGSTFPPSNLLIISSSTDVNELGVFDVEGWTWQPRGSMPARVVINTTKAPLYLGLILPLELAHVFAATGNHSGELFNLCDNPVF